MSDNWSPVRTPIGHAGQGWSNKRKFRFLRTITAVLLVVWLVGRCTGGDDEAESPDTTSADSADEGTDTDSGDEPTADPTSLNASVLEVALSEPRYQSGAATLDGVVILPGGLDGERNSTATILQFDPSGSGEDPDAPSGAVTDIGTLPAALHKAMPSRIGDRVIAFGGAKGDVRFDAVTAIDPEGAAESFSVLPQPRSDGAAVSSEVDGATYIVGGTDGVEPLLDVLRTTDGETFEVVAELTEPTRYPAVAVNGSAIFVMGGTWEGEDSDSIQRIDVATGETSLVGKLPERTSHAMGFSIGGSIFVAGGVTGESRTDAILRIDPATGAASPAGTLPNALSDAAVASVEGTTYLLGGLTPEVTGSIVAVEAAA